MLTSARKTMPALDYVSIIRSVYGDRRGMLAASFASAFTAGLTAYRSQSLGLYLIAAALAMMGVVRFWNMQAFWRASIDNDDADAAQYWEDRAVLIGTVLALIFGLWCFASMLWVNDPFAELASVSLSIAVMVGICARNFGLDRLVTVQMLSVIVPMAAGFFLKNDFYHASLAALLVVMLATFRKLAGDIRSILLSAVHGRVEASRLSAELDMAITTLEHGLCLLDEKGAITVANNRALRLFAGLGAAQPIGEELRSLLLRLADDGALTPRPAVDRLVQLVDTGTAGKVLLSLTGGRFFEISVSAQHDRCVLLFEDISERVASEERINFMARHDALTKLPNRSYFGELVSADLAARRTTSPERPVALMVVDIDDFKHVNDTYGHVVGDELLLEVARRLREANPQDAVLARLGGDEFVIYRGHAGDAEIDSDHVLAAFAPPFRLPSATLNVSASIGIVTSVAEDDSLDVLMTKADLALYTAKADGKSKAQVFHAQMDTDYHYRQRLKSDLRQTVEAGGLTLAFQPLIDMASRKVVSCEALARWEHPTLGAIPPSVFIPLAEETGIISDITAWVITEAVRQCSLWPSGVGVAVNVSGRDFRAIDLVEVVDTALAFSELDPSRLEIEVTESAVIDEQGIAHGILSGLATRGVGIALDDFGTGYSSLSYLSALPFTKLKIDRSFVENIDTDPKALRLLGNVARLGRDLDLIVVAEGVETEAQLDAMVEHTAIQQVQGYLFSRPLPQRDISELIFRLNTQPRLNGNRRHG